MSALTAPPHERDAVWKEVRERLRSTLNSQTYKFAFAGARPRSSSTDERIVLAVDTELLRQWIRQRYLPLLRDALFEVRGADLQVEARGEAAPRRSGRPRGGPRRRPAGAGAGRLGRRRRRAARAGCSRASPSRPS